MRVALKFAYDGLLFHGYARQPGLRTVEGNILELLHHWGAYDDVSQAAVRVGSRTDGGVSALGNVLALTTTLTPPELFSHMPGPVSDLLVYGAKTVDDDFYPRHALRRQYRYYLRSDGLDISAMQQAGNAFLGSHDFRNFARLEPGKDPVRCVESLTLTYIQPFIVVDVVAQTFLWNQVRRMVSALVKVGKGTISRDDIVRALDDPEQRVDYGLAPAEPLILNDITYSFTFSVQPEAFPLLAYLESRIVSRL